MKNYIAGLFLAFTFTTASAADMPKDIIPTSNIFTPEVHLVFNFNSDFPNSESVKWTKSEGKIYVEFINPEKRKSIAVYKNGELQEIYYGISINNIPTVSKSHLNTKLPEFQIENAYIVKKDGENDRFLVEIKGTDDVLYSKDGYLLRYVK